MHTNNRAQPSWTDQHYWQRNGIYSPFLMQARNWVSFFMQIHLFFQKMPREPIWRNGFRCQHWLTGEQTWAWFSVLSSFSIVPQMLMEGGERNEKGKTCFHPANPFIAFYPSDVCVAKKYPFLYGGPSPQGRNKETVTQIKREGKKEKWFFAPTPPTILVLIFILEPWNLWLWPLCVLVEMLSGT